MHYLIDPPIRKMLCFVAECPTVNTRKATMSAFSKFCLSIPIIAVLGSATMTRATQTPQQSSSNPGPNADKQFQPSKSHQPRPNPDENGKYHIGDGVTPPILIHSVEPEFAKNISHAQCTVSLTVSADGKPADVHLVEPKNENEGTLSTEARMLCINAAERYRFKPAIFQGKPVAVDLKVEINYGHF
jgi:Gram-negative bacterial TonB protein C-terminal